MASLEDRRLRMPPEDQGTPGTLGKVGKGPRLETPEPVRLDWGLPCEMEGELPLAALVPAFTA